MPAPAWSFRHHWMAHTATHARMRPDKPALRYRGESVTWAQLSRRSLQLAAGGPTVTQGYWNKPEETEEAFAGGWFHSGDLVRQDDEGFIWVVDRKKDMIISGGENIYCAELENAIADHPDIVDVAVIGRPDERWGQVPIAVVTARPGRELTLADLAQFLSGKLASFKMPKDLVVLTELPRNAGGKVVKGELRALDRERIEGVV